MTILSVFVFVFSLVFNSFNTERFANADVSMVRDARKVTGNLQKEDSLNQLFSLIQETAKGNIHKNMLAQNNFFQNLVIKSMNKRQYNVGNLEGNKTLHTDQYEKVPSLMVEMLKEQKSKSMDRILGKKQQNIVRTTKNTGPVAFSYNGTIIAELKFDFEELLQEEEILDAALFFTTASNAPSTKHTRSDAFRFSLYSLGNRNIRKLRKLIETSTKNFLGLNSFEVDIKELNARFFSILGTPLTTGSIVKGRLVSQRSLRSKIISLSKTFRDELLRHRFVTNQLILFVERSEKSEFLFPHEIDSQFCLRLPEILFIMISRNVSGEQIGENGGDLIDQDVSRQKQALFATEREIVSSNFSDNKKRNHFPIPNLNLENIEKTIHSRNVRSLHSSICQRHSMWVDFADLGWSDWVIAPRAFQAYICAGACPYPLAGRLNSTNYAMLMTMMNSVDPQNSPQPCCAPISLRPVSILYLDKSDNVVLRNYEGMIVQGCGCR